MSAPKHSHQESDTHSKEKFSVPTSLDEVKELLKSFLFHKSPDKAFIRELLVKVNDIFKKERNIIRFPCLDDSQTLSIVGDIHSDLEDLQEIFNTAGWPSKENLFVFNGDFVDRGQSGIEVICVLLSLKIIFPSSVYLLRGNHEDSNLGKAYGFFDEMFRKYKSKNLYYEMEECFSYLPICALLENQLFIVHGGLPRNKKTTLDDIDSIPRSKFTEVVSGAAKEDHNEEEQKHREILEDLLWSDPDPYKNGTRSNTKRGAGSLFGTDFARTWLGSINVKTLVRSHECVEDGYEEINCGDGYRIYTVFSSSNYSGGTNLGAVLRYSKNTEEPQILQFEAKEPRSIQDIEEYNQKSLTELICKSYKELCEEFGSHDTESLITLEQWNNGLSRVLSLDIDWKDAIDIEPFTKDAPEGHINYKEFLEQFSVCGVNSDDTRKVELFAKHEQLAAVFKIFDIEKDGRVSKREFITACNLLNHYLPKEKQTTNSAQLFELADHNKTGDIDYEEFCALFERKV
eukprot:CAMPEP_0206194876 /NCGR_PEP_ID=MMETSP0166-20121206/7481_1 /ASSEMBLY_ACC=CAM_ASM_000260 /TAXON_ID=95228 /ORGANISM="Vannella robusta, Strain DIVA3 518/3/11/1/6" /LENGTH=514 /DNA_ID=CAMNT_0053611979 /DNA_START=1496 /DNA_END=3040 /DNA_ORIENTATION=-